MANAKKVKVTNVGKRDRERLGHVFPAPDSQSGKKTTVEVEVTTSRHMLALRACRDLEVEEVGEIDEDEDEEEASSRAKPQPPGTAPAPTGAAPTIEAGEAAEPTPGGAPAGEGEGETTPAPAPEAGEPFLFATNDAAKAAITDESSPAQLRAWYIDELQNPQHEGGRKGVKDAIEERLGELEVEDVETFLTGGE